MGKGAGKTGSRGSSSSGKGAAPMATAPASLSLPEIRQRAAAEVTSAIARGDIEAAVNWTNVATHAAREIDHGTPGGGPKRGESLLDYGRRYRG